MTVSPTVTLVCVMQAEARGGDGVMCRHSVHANGIARGAADLAAAASVPLLSSYMSAEM